MAALAPPALRPSAPKSLSAPLLPKQFARPSSIKRRSTLKRSIDESSLMDAPLSPSKRSRVTFDADVEIHSADDEDDLDPVILKEQVRRAIERHLQSDNNGYDKFRSVFAASPNGDHAPSAKILKLHLGALVANVTRLNGDCSDLVNTVISSEWVGRSDDYCMAFCKFLGNLAAAQAGYMVKIMGMLVGLLGPQKTRRLPNTKVVRQLRIHKRVFNAIRYITQLAPTASGALADRIRAKLDFDFQKADDRMMYIKNFMGLIDYVPELTSEILTNVMRQLIKLDTSVQADLDEEEDDAEDDILQHMSASQTLAFAQSQVGMDEVSSGEDDSFSTTDESDLEDDEELDATTLVRRKLKEDVKQVDMIMDMLFRYYGELTGSENLQTRDNAIEQMVAQFNNLILPTYRSRHPQFLIFHFAQTDPVIVDRFIANCISILLDKRQPQIMRHAAAAYFSGFVGRGAHVPSVLVQDCIDLLCDQLDRLRTEYEPRCRGPDLKVFGDFYSMFQAIMYIFCFRWRDIGTSTSDLEDDSDLEDEENQDYQFPPKFYAAIHAAIYSRLNPLRICSPAIVEQFAKLTMALQFLYVYPKIEENKGVRVTTSWRSVADMSINQPDRDMTWVGDNGLLEGYFPYDPYHLPISKRWLSSDYVEWQGIPGEEQEESDSENEMTEYDALEDLDVDEVDSD